MRHRLGDRDRAFSLRCEFGPIIGDRGVVVELSALDQQGDDQRRNGLGGRIDRAERALAPGDFLLAVRKAAAQIDDRLIAQIGGEAGAEFQPLLEILLEGLAHRLEPGGDMSA